MPIQPSIIDQTKYREVKFLGGRILQASELQRLEDLQRVVRVLAGPGGRLVSLIESADGPDLKPAEDAVDIRRA